MQGQYTNQKPEYVLKRANDLINSATGNAIKEKTWALEMLHNFIAAKKKVLQWSKVYETLMKRHLELCIDLKNPHFAKDGLHQYRNLCQTMDPNSLEVVILHMMDITEAEATKARAKADKVALAAAAKVSDLDQEDSPESIMLSSMTEAGAKDRTDREVVVPWLKFLWETYRAVLELLHRIPKLDKVYHKICEKAFKFCQDYSRTLEFRRLCEMLRTHLINLQRTSTRTPKVVWEWTSDIVELHLQTRFSQLEVATTLELWNESFRTVEDIHAIIVAGRKTPKPKLMAIYYEKLTRIFWVSGNHLFHAFAYFRYFNLSLEYRGSKDLKHDEKSLLASYVLLSALTIPSLKDSDYSMTIMEDESVTGRNQQMATILDFQSNPSRKALLADIVSKGLLNDVLPELKGLHELIDTKFQPLTMIKNVGSILTFIKSHPQLNIYATPLQRIIVLRVIQQLSKVYSVVKIDFLKSLFNGLPDINFITAEKTMVDGVIRKELQLSVDHINNVVKFMTCIPTSQTIENQVTQFGNELNSIKYSITHKEATTAAAASLATTTATPEIIATVTDRASVLQRIEKQVNERKEIFQKILANAETQHSQLFSRKNIIERRKVDIERAQEEKEKVQQIILDREGARRQAEEEHRLEVERIKREEEKRKKLQEKEDIKRIQKDLERLGVYKDEATLAALDLPSRQALVTEAKMELIKAKEEENRKVAEQAKRIDHITRALRIEASEVLKKRHAAQYQDDLKAYNTECAKLIDETRKSHTAKAEEKKRLSRVQSARQVFEQSLLADQKLVHEKLAASIKEKMIRDYRERKVAAARRDMYEEQERIREEEEIEKERIEKEERARLEREQYEILRKKRQEEEAMEKAKEEENARIKEVARAELEAKRQKAIEEQKLKMKLSSSASVSSGVSSGFSEGGENGNGSSMTAAASATVAAPVEKEIKWRAPPASASAASATPGELPAVSVVPAKWRGASAGDRDTRDGMDSRFGGGAGVSSAESTAGASVDKWRPSGMRGGGSGTSDVSGGGSERERPSTSQQSAGGSTAWRGSSTGGGGDRGTSGGAGAGGGGTRDWGRPSTQGGASGAGSGSTGGRPMFTNSSRTGGGGDSSGGSGFDSLRNREPQQPKPVATSATNGTAAANGNGNTPTNEDNNWRKK